MLILNAKSHLPCPSIGPLIMHVSHSPVLLAVPGSYQFSTEEYTDTEHLTVALRTEVSHLYHVAVVPMK